MKANYFDTLFRIASGKPETPTLSESTIPFLIQQRDHARERIRNILV
jgi:hypothetical protein